MNKKERALMGELKQLLHELYNKAEEAFLSFDGAKPMESREVMKDYAALALIVERLTWKEGDKTADFVLQAADDEYNAEMSKYAPVISESRFLACSGRSARAG